MFSFLRSRIPASDRPVLFWGRLEGVPPRCFSLLICFGRNGAGFSLFPGFDFLAFLSLSFFASIQMIDPLRTSFC